MIGHLPRPMRWLACGLSATLMACNAPAPLSETDTPTTMTQLDLHLKARDTIGVRQELVGADAVGKGRIVYYSLGQGRPVVMFASAGREASDFNELARSLADRDYHVVLVQPPHVDGALPSAREPNLFDLAKDVEPILSSLDQPAILVGHAFGNRLARATATQYPEYTAGVILLAAGGKRPIPEAADRALKNAFNPSLSLQERQEAVGYGFFAGDNPIPDYWMRGWHGQTGRLQGKATASTASDAWWAGGTSPMLVISGLQDTIAPPEDTIDLLEAEFSGRVTAIRLDGAGHALLPEKPDEIATAMLAWLDMLPNERPDQ